MNVRRPKERARARTATACCARMALTITRSAQRAIDEAEVPFGGTQRSDGDQAKWGRYGGNELDPPSLGMIENELLESAAVSGICFASSRFTAL